MNISKFTQKSMQAVERCEKLAYEYGNQEIEQEHLLYALLNQENGILKIKIIVLNNGLIYLMELFLVWQGRK